MVIPGWRYLVSGGTTGQVFTKVSGADGDYVWATPSSGGATITGSATQIAVCDGAGNAAGDANLTWDSASLIFSAGDIGTAVNRTRIVINDSTKQALVNTSGVLVLGDYDQSVGGMWVQVDNQFGRIISWGDLGGLNNGTSCTVDDATKTFSANCVAAVFAVDGANQKTTSNVKHEMSNGSGTVTIQLDAATGTWTFTLPVDDGDSGDVLTTDGSGNTSWVAPSGGSGLTSPQVLSRSLGS